MSMWRVTGFNEHGLRLHIFVEAEDKETAIEAALTKEPSVRTPVTVLFLNEAMVTPGTGPAVDDAGVPGPAKLLVELAQTAAVCIRIAIDRAHECPTKESAM